MTEEETIRVLAVRQPWASLIVEGLKTIEVRSRNTNIRGPVAIYASKTDYPGKTYTELSSHFLSQFDMNNISGRQCGKAIDCMNKNKGFILGTVEISDSTQRPVIGKNLFNGFVNKHLAPEKYFVEKKTFFWHLENPVKFAEPVKLPKWPSGGPWAKVPKSILPELE